MWVYLKQTKFSNRVKVTPLKPPYSFQMKLFWRNKAVRNRQPSIFFRLLYTLNSFSCGFCSWFEEKVSQKLLKRGLGRTGCEGGRQAEWEKPGSKGWAWSWRKELHTECNNRIIRNETGRWGGCSVEVNSVEWDSNVELAVINFSSWTSSTSCWLSWSWNNRIVKKHHNHEAHVFHTTFFFCNSSNFLHTIYIEAKFCQSVDSIRSMFSFDWLISCTPPLKNRMEILK